MNDTLRKKLREIILNYGPDVSRDPKRCKALLLDYGSGHRREIYVLVAAVEERIPEQLVEAQDDGLDGPLPGLTRRLAYQLAEPRSMELEAAQWAVETWAFAMGLPLLDSPASSQAPPEPRPATPTPSPAPNAPSQTGNASRAKVVPAIVVPPGPPRIRRSVSSRTNARVRVPLTVFAAVGTVIACSILCRILGITMDAITVTVPTPTYSVTPPITTEASVTAMNGPEISPKNAGYVMELERWGEGKAQEIAYSPDGKLLAVATSIGIYLYDTQELSKVQYIDAGAVPKMAFSPDGTILASGAERGYVNLWQLNSGAPPGNVATLRETLKVKAYVSSIAFSPDGTMLAVGDGYGIMKLWQVSYAPLEENAAPGTALVRGSKLLRELEQHSRVVSSIAFSPDSKMLASGSWDGTINLWRISDNAPTVESSVLLHTLQVGAGYVFDAAFSPNGEILASGSANDDVKLWRVYDGKLWRTLKGHTNYVESVAFSPDGTMVASGSWDNTIRLWQMSDGALLNTYEGHRNAVESVLFSPDGTTLASWAQDDAIRLWQVNDETQPSVALESHSNPIPGVTFTDGGEVIVAKFVGDAVELWQMSNGAPFEKGALLRTIKENAPLTSDVAFSPDRTMLAWGIEDGNVRLWRESDVMIPRRLGSHDGSVHSVAFSPDGTLLASGFKDSTVKLWAISSGALLRMLDGGKGIVDSVAFSPDGVTLAAGDNDGVVRLWRVRDGEVLYTFNRCNYVHSVAFSPDGTLLAAGCGLDVKIWQLSDHAPIHTLTGHAQAVMSVVFSPDGTVLASGSGDSTIALWRVSDGLLLSTLTRHTDAVQNVAFSPDGTMLVSRSEDGTVRLWGLPGQP